MLLIIQAASFWMEDFGYSRAWPNTFNMPVLMAIWVCSSIPATMLPIVWRQGVKTLSSELVISSTSLDRVPVVTTRWMFSLPPSVR